MRLLLRWVIAAVSVAAAAYVVPGIHVGEGNGIVIVAVMALILGFVNAVVRPILAFLSCGCIVATLGLFMLIVNAISFWLAAKLTDLFLPGAFTVDSLLAAILGSIVVSVVSFVLSILLPDDQD